MASREKENISDRNIMRKNEGGNVRPGMKKGEVVKGWPVEIASLGARYQAGEVKPKFEGPRISV